MPLGRFLKILFSGLFALVVGLVVAVEFSLIESYGNVNNYAAYEQAAKVSYDYVHTTGAAVINYVYATGAAIIKWLKDRSHDDWLTISTVFIAVFTGCLWWSTSKLWKSTNATLKLTRDGFNAAHRPRLRVRRIHFMPLITGQPVRLKYEVVNRGEATAKIILSDIHIQVQEHDGKEILVDGRATSIHDLMAGESVPMLAEMTVPYQGEWELTPSMAIRIKVWGVIKYMGGLSYMETAFERFYNHRTGSFQPSETPNPDFEHED